MICSPTTPIVQKLFKVVGPHFKDRNGGYTRIVKTSQWKIGDATDYVIVQLVGIGKVQEKAPPKKAAKGKAKKAKTPALQLHKPPIETSRPRLPPGSFFLSLSLTIGNFDSYNTPPDISFVSLIAFVTLDDAIAGRGIAMPLVHDPESPTTEESEVAKSASRQLAPFAAELSSKTVKMDITSAGKNITIELPTVAVQLFIRILTEMSRGNAVTLMPIHAMLTTQEAADLLGVSRPFITKELASGNLNYTQVGTHRRIAYKDLMQYKARQRVVHDQAMDELVKQAQEENFGY